MIPAVLVSAAVGVAGGAAWLAVQGGAGTLRSRIAGAVFVAACGIVAAALTPTP